MRHAGFIFMKEMVLHNVNTEANQFVIGVPGITSFTGFGHLIERKLKEACSILPSIEGVGIIVHEMVTCEARMKSPGVVQGMNPKRVLAPGIIDETKGEMRASLVLRLFIDENDSAALFNQDVLAALLSIKQDLLGSSIAGGSVLDFSDVSYYEANDEPALWTSIAQCAPGFFVKDRSDLLAPSDDYPDDDLLDRLMHALVVVETEDDDEIAYRRHQSGWIIPIATGYQGIESPQVRDNVHQDALHVYAEPMIGLGEMISSKSLALSDDPKLEENDVLWVHRTQNENNAYFVVAK